jgi:hypothetical protein
MNNWTTKDWDIAGWDFPPRPQPVSLVLQAFDALRREKDLREWLNVRISYSMHGRTYEGVLRFLDEWERKP